MKDNWDGLKIPNVSLESSSGKNLELPQDILGTWSLFFFYPKDDTPGCTLQACNYRDHLLEFQKNSIEIYGISMDDLNSHKDFINKFDLNFILLTDTNAELSGQLEVYGEQEWKGKLYMGLSRDSFLIDPEGVIRKVWRKVDPQTTIQETLAEAVELIGG